jgi:hypothetical protein
MYRYNVDQGVIYSPEDIVLFRESPFASWMERLTLENPTHGIPPDVDSSAPAHSPTPQPELTATLLEEGKDVIGIDCEEDEATRRTATLAAMRHGVDFIVSGQLSVGPLSDSANLLMRTSGYSELGDYLYIPCDTQKKTSLSSAFRLCFLADLLHSLQGQLPPQMLILRGNSGVVPLQTEDHIYHYRAVKQRFMSAQSSFKKHSMPDPVDSAHFGRWSECANELLKQRALGQSGSSELQDDEWQEEIEIARPQGGQAQASAYDLDVVASTVRAEEVQARDVRVPQQTTGTLAEQARMLSPEQSPMSTNSVVTDSLHHLEFIGSSTQPPTIGELAAVRPLNPVSPESRQFSEPPPANLRNPAIIDMDVILDPGPNRDKPEVKPFSNSLITSGDN